MTNSITPPPELIEQWWNAALPNRDICVKTQLCTQAARWGADQELEACCEWLDSKGSPNASRLRAARRPKPPSLKEQALKALGSIERGQDRLEDTETIRRALEQLDD